MGLNIQWWTADEDGCGHYRMIYPATAMSERGFNCYVSPTYMHDVDMDIVIGQRVSNPGATKYWNEYLTDLPRIFEIDDDLWNVHHTSSAYAYYCQQDVKGALAANAACADAITTTTPFLAEVMSEHNDNVHVLPNYLPESIFELEPHEQAGETVTLGWSGGPTHVVDAPVLKYPLKQALKHHKNVNFHATGWNMGANLKLPNRSFTHWTRDLDEHYKRLNFDIGLCPLAPNTFNRSKSPIKALEYAARGIPVIASDDGPYDLLADQEWITLCRTDQDWSRALRELINDYDKRVELGNKAYEYAKTQTYSKNIHQWEDLITSF